MSVHSSQRRKRRDGNRFKVKGMNHSEFLSRIRKTLYYGKLPMTDCFTLPVTEFAAELYSKVKAGRSVDRLRLEEAADMSRNTCVSPCSLVLAVLYLDRLKALNPQYLDSAVPSELFLISVMVASKFLNDDGEDDEVLNSEWASSAGLSLKHINRLEKQFLSAIRWEVFVKDTTFWSSLRDMERHIALSEGKKRGWFSYTELESLLDLIDSFTLAHTLLTVSMVCLASYTAGVLTLVGSTLLVSQVGVAYLPVTRPPDVLIPTVVHDRLPDSHQTQLASPPVYRSCYPYNDSLQCERLGYDLNENEDWNRISVDWFGGLRETTLPQPETNLDNNNNDSLIDFDFVFADGYNLLDDKASVNYLITVARYLSDLSGQISRGLPPIARIVAAE